MNMLIMPVANGILPRPQGGKVTAVFLKENGGQILKILAKGSFDIFLCPIAPDNFNVPTLYPVGVIARIADIWEQKIIDPQGREVEVVMAALEGRGHARWNTLKEEDGIISSDSVHYINLKKMRPEYPAISGAGWLASGGYTEMRDKNQIKVTIYGKSLETGQDVSITGNLGGLVAPEQAHTIEHSIIRALNSVCLCSAKTLVESMQKETMQLKKSVEMSIKYTMPEALGVTESGFCGNPMTNLAQVYLTKEFTSNIISGKSLTESLEKARKATMSQLTNDIGLTHKPALRALQGLKKGMLHDDTLLKIETYKKVIAKFPFDPWEQ